MLQIKIALGALKRYRKIKRYNYYDHCGAYSIKKFNTEYIVVSRLSQILI